MGRAWMRSGSDLSIEAALGLGIDLLAPIIVGLVAASLARVAGQRPDLDALDARLAIAGTNAAELEAHVRGIDGALVDCLTRTERMSELASARGQGLAASAAALAAAAGEVARVGSGAQRAADALAATLPEMVAQTGEIDLLLRKLGAESAQQVQATEALLATARLRGGEAAAQADATIAKIALQIAQIDTRSKETTSEIAKRAYVLDAAMDGVLERTTAVLDSIGERANAQTQGLETRMHSIRWEVDRIGDENARVVGQRLDSLLAAAGQLRLVFSTHEEQTLRSIEATDAHLRDLPQRIDSAQRAGGAALDWLAERTGVLHASLADLRTPFQASRATIAGLAEQLEALHHTADAFGSGLAERLPATTEALERVAEETTALTQRIDGLRDALAASAESTREVTASVEAARIQTAALGEDDARRIGDRLALLNQASARLGETLGAHGERSEAARIVVERDLGAIEVRLREVGDDGTARLTALADGIDTVRESLGDLAAPLSDTCATLADMEAHVGGMSMAVDTFGREIDVRLPATTTGLLALSQNTSVLLDRVDELKVAVAEGASGIGGVSDMFMRERERLADASDALLTHFDRAHGEVERLRDETTAAASAAADQLGPTFARARELAVVGADAARAMLDRIVLDTERALDRAGSSTAEAAFGAPIRIHLAALEDAAGRAGNAADAAAKRIAGQTRVLDSTIASVDAKVAELETRLDVRARDTLSARSARLIAMLNEASVDVARLLAIDAGDKAWLRYLKGDRSIFARHTARLIDRESSRKIARHFEHDGAFNEEASRYLGIFETLTRRLLSDPDGEALTATMVSSDLGKLYVAIARATGRWSPAVESSVRSA